jgi:hypothetical protein
VPLEGGLGRPYGIYGDGRISGFTPEIGLVMMKFVAVGVPSVF